MASKTPQALLVTTAHHGVFYGYGLKTDAKIITLKKARMCVYWDSSLRGVMGLATFGPNANCKIGPSCDEITLQDVTMIADVSEIAIANWEKGLWS